MGMFEDEEKKMADEVAAEVRQQAEKKAERNRVAHAVQEDLRSYMAKHPPGQDVDISLYENLVSLRKKTSGNTLDIKCSGYFELIIDGKVAISGDQSTMARAVIDWIKR
jgi:hypothetical protein